MDSSSRDVREQEFKTAFHSTGRLETVFPGSEVNRGSFKGQSWPGLLCSGTQRSEANRPRPHSNKW
jgi:hypothetical protein